MKQLKKTLLTLVALFAMTGAWAQTETLLTTIESTVNKTFRSGNKTFDNIATVTFSGQVVNDGDDWGWYFGLESGQTITVTAASDAYTITRVKFYSADGSAFDEEAPFEAIVMFEGGYIAKVNGTSIGHWGVNKIEVYGYEGAAAPASSGPKVEWNAANKSGTFTMPGGNVTLEPEYYPQAALAAAPTAINDVPATTDGAIVSAGTVANIGETTKAQGTVMYYVSKTEMTDAALLALAADQWTADVPTAADLAQGQAYVYYYVRGNDSNNDDENFSDGDILALAVTLAAAPLWNAEFDLTDAPEEDKAGKWSTDIPEGGVVKGTEVKVTYTGTKKVIGVKAEKKAAPAAAEGHALSASAVGEIVGTDGKAYAVADKDNLPEGVTAVAMVAYKSATAGSSLAIALADQGSMRWSTAKSQCAGKTAIGGKSWKLPSQGEWKQMFSANGDNEGQYTGLNTAITNAGGTALASTLYWSSSSAPAPDDDYDERAWAVNLGGGGASWESTDPAYYKQVRACLAF